MHLDPSITNQGHTAAIKKEPPLEKKPLGKERLFEMLF